MAARPAKLITRWHVAAVVAAIVVVLAGLAAAQASPTRIVSLVPAVTEILFAIGAGPQVVAVSTYDDFPEPVKALPRVGALLDPDVERILALRPQLVISYGSQTDLQAQLGRARISVYDYRHAGLAGILATIRDVGRVSGRPSDGERLARDLEARLDGIRTRMKGRRRPRTLLVFGRDPTTLRGIYVSGGRGFLHDMLEVAGGENVFADIDREGVQPSQETLLMRAPDVILEVRASSTAAQRDAAAEVHKAWAPLASIPAVRDGRIYFVIGAYTVVPGPRVAQAAEAFARALHPEAEAENRAVSPQVGTHPHQ